MLVLVLELEQGPVVQPQPKLVEGPLPVLVLVPAVARVVVEAREGCGVRSIGPRC